ncbi:YggS family pyridoxal phosphate-dependent enzyme [Agitococcus lubricus]|uniref:Pyridoxal phosphate homeostasis protein n=1 Tax=Agitococcus lubricus TaxID=1077255 RepID=A0A2T5J3F0_9GAMM|nr:YggS family pyridoxal phosphate-dependent enzyme [Agitococcus lubricus]PTQ91149.1 hypothetical protein C8N29_101221 [Agitococcus lubricus]
MQDISQHLQQVLRRMALACDRAGRPAHTVKLLAVSKTQSVDAIMTAYQAGQRDFGENYVQEALTKIPALAHLGITWHLIGHLQSNKASEVARYFAWVHSVDRLKIAQRLSAYRPDTLPPLNICLQVNIDAQESKSGCTIAELPALIHAILALPRVSLRGLMIIPQAGNEQAFTDLVNLRQHLLMTIPTLDADTFDTLSMGMSADMDAAIAAGSTMVRVGTAIFGHRLTR